MSSRHMCRDPLVVFNCQSPCTILFSDSTEDWQHNVPVSNSLRRIQLFSEDCNSQQLWTCMQTTPRTQTADTPSASKTNKISTMQEKSSTFQYRNDGELVMIISSVWHWNLRSDNHQTSRSFDQAIHYCADVQCVRSISFSNLKIVWPGQCCGWTDIEGQVRDSVSDSQIIWPDRQVLF